MSAAYAIERARVSSSSGTTLLPADLRIYSGGSSGIARFKTEAGLHALLRLVLAGIDELSDGINSGVLSIAEWRDAMADALAVGHIAAYQEGRDSRELGNISRRQLNATLEDQIAYLNNFANDIDKYGWTDRSDRARAGLYVGALKQSYWQGATFGLEMPFYPTVGSECMVNCKCSWEIIWENEEELNATAYWRLSANEHCRTCRRRADRNPYQFRGGELL